MKYKVAELLTELKKRKNPRIIASELNRFLIQSLREGKISLYEAYLINAEVLNFARDGYILPAWQGFGVSISNCIMLLNQWMMANVFQDEEYAKQLQVWAVEAAGLCKEKRKHYIMDKYQSFFEEEERKALLQKLADVRKKYDSLSFDEGPYHVEAFPYDFFAPEEVLTVGKELNESMEISEEIQELLVELSIGWED
ncbi:MAG: hypothetical protein IJ379_06975 [Lachnospiraceae bacterium]|nr:hypothetical protein [Lachnospiraceae bacterium]